MVSLQVVSDERAFDGYTVSVRLEHAPSGFAYYDDTGLQGVFVQDIVRLRAPEIEAELRELAEGSLSRQARRSYEVMIEAGDRTWWEIGHIQARQIAGFPTQISSQTMRADPFFTGLVPLLETGHVRVTVTVSSSGGLGFKPATELFHHFSLDTTALIPSLDRAEELLAESKQRITTGERCDEY